MVKRDREPVYVCSRLIRPADYVEFHSIFESLRQKALMEGTGLTVEGRAG